MAPSRASNRRRVLRGLSIVSFLGLLGLLWVPLHGSHADGPKQMTAEAAMGIFTPSNPVEDHRQHVDETCGMVVCHAALAIVSAAMFTPSRSRSPSLRARTWSRVPGINPPELFRPPIAEWT
jgi:hypothetical protein